MAEALTLVDPLGDRLVRALTAGSRDETLREAERLGLFATAVDVPWMDASDG